MPVYRRAGGCGNPPISSKLMTIPGPRGPCAGVPVYRGLLWWCPGVPACRARPVCRYTGGPGCRDINKKVFYFERLVAQVGSVSTRPPKPFCFLAASRVG